MSELESKVIDVEVKLPKVALPKEKLVPVATAKLSLPNNCVSKPANKPVPSELFIKSPLVNEVPLLGYGPGLYAPLPMSEKLIVDTSAAWARVDPSIAVVPKTNNFKRMVFISCTF